MNKIKVGEIINTHGIRGELKILTTGSEDFKRDIFFYIENTKVKVQNAKVHKNAHLIKLVGYDNINDVLEFKGKSIYILENDLLELEDDEFYVKDLVGLEVFENDNYIGKLKEVLEYQANDVYVIETKTSEIMIPAVDEFILDIDLDNNKMNVKLIEGM